MKNIEHARKLFEESIVDKQNIVKSNCLDSLVKIAAECVNVIENGGKIMFCGNGGSAADAQHLAAELSIRLRSSVNRESIAALNLATDSSVITACGNDYGFDCIYSRMVEALGKPEDALIGITTSGKSLNIINALKLAHKRRIKTFGFLGGSGKPALEYCDEAFIVPSDVTGRIQEAHITAGHILVELIEDKLLENGFISLLKQSC